MIDFWGSPAASIGCNKGYDFATEPAHVYQCFSDGNWLLWPQSATMPWPDCTGNILLTAYSSVILTQNF